jgi:signal transduction histidine kinase
MLDGRLRRLGVALAADPPGPRRPWLRAGPLDLVVLADLLIAAAVFAGTYSWLVTQNLLSHTHHAGPTLMLIALALSVPMALRDRRPLTAWAWSAVALGISAVVIPPRSISGVPSIPGGVFVYLLCLYSLGVRCRREVAIVAALVTIVGVAVIDVRTAAAALPMLVPLLVGQTVRLRRAGRAEMAEVERRHGAERAVLEERQRIAREMHDVVAHRMSLIAIQAEAAPLTVPDVPAKIRRDLAEIRATALEALTELRGVLGVLRGEDGSETAPQPGLDQLDDLIAGARGAGLTVATSISGSPVPLGPGTELTAYRIIQEALSNAMRHARGSVVRTEIAYGPAGLRVEIVNGAGDGTAPGGSGSGRGLVGMRERVAMLGGELEVGPLPDGGFEVRAVLPVHPRTERTEGER